MTGAGDGALMTPSSAPARWRCASCSIAAVAVIFASGLKYVGVATTALGWILCATLLGLGTAWLVFARPWMASAAAGSAEAETEAGAEGEATAAEQRPLVHEPSS